MFTMHIEWPLERPHMATVRSVIDGDTIRVDIDMDLRTALSNYKVRLAGCNAAEVDTDAGKAARDHLQTVLLPGMQIVLLTIKDYKYGGEFIARVFLPDGTELVPKLIEEQWLAPWNGRGPAPVPPWPRTVSRDRQSRVSPVRE
ncbi:thermonuclease family protein [Rhodococcus koreensis]